MPHLEPSQDHKPLHFSACTKHLEVILGPGVMNLLIEPGDLTDTADTHFDLWLHTMVTHAANDYNRL